VASGYYDQHGGFGSFIHQYTTGYACLKPFGRDLYDSADGDDSARRRLRRTTLLTRPMEPAPHGTSSPCISQALHCGCHGDRGRRSRWLNNGFGPTRVCCGSFTPLFHQRFTPAFSPAPGNLQLGRRTVTISTTTPSGGTIHFTTDGIYSNGKASPLYSGSITVGCLGRLSRQFRPFATGFIQTSAVGSAAYTINLAGCRDSGLSARQGAALQFSAVGDHRHKNHAFSDHLLHDERA